MMAVRLFPSRKAWAGREKKPNIRLRDQCKTLAFFPAEIQATETPPQREPRRGVTASICLGAKSATAQIENRADTNQAERP